jgi:hypothetical protein
MKRSLPYGSNPFSTANNHNNPPAIAVAVAKEWITNPTESIELCDMSDEPAEQLPWERKAAEIEARVSQNTLPL